jgi:urease accessory protein
MEHILYLHLRLDGVSLMSSTQIRAGGGRIVVSQHNGNPVFSELSSTYPLKLLSPRVHQKSVAVVYALTYGGGLVGGDQVHLSAEIDQATILVLLTQVGMLVSLLLF